MVSRMIRTTVVVFAMICFMATLGYTAQKLTGTVQEVDTTNATFMLATEDGKVTKLRVPIDFLEDLAKGKKVEVLVEDGMVVAVDKAGKSDD